ncbi:hypothetical protein NPIL_492961 [Nephila pilipes]|uniref:Uncharacterized protein n=1 Tax=Nephila pilipes TaxID=299642 RepID=A0A8X6NDD9_NEPPI|nr:hypothetical protein NPIL_492961 [Nephila pilipes]
MLVLIFGVVGRQYNCSDLLICKISSELGGILLHLPADLVVAGARLSRSLDESPGADGGEGRFLKSLQGADEGMNRSLNNLLVARNNHFGPNYIAH